LRERQCLEAAHQDGFDRAVTRTSDGECSTTRRLESPGAVLFPELNQTATRTKSLLGMVSRSHDFFHHLGGRWSGFSGPIDISLRSPLESLLMLGRHMFLERGVPALVARQVGFPGVRGDAPSWTKRHLSGLSAPVQVDLEHICSQPNLDLFPRVFIGYRVVVFLHFDVIIRAHSSFLPLRDDIRLERKRL